MQPSSSLRVAFNSVLLVTGFRKDSRFAAIEVKVNESGKDSGSFYSILSFRFWCHAHIYSPVFLIILANIVGKQSIPYLTNLVGKEHEQVALTLILASVGSLSFFVFDWVFGAYADKKGCKAAIQLGLALMAGVMVIFASISVIPSTLGIDPVVLALIGQALVGLPLSLIDAADSQLTRKISASIGLTEREQDYVEGICTARKYAGLALASFIGCLVFIVIAKGFDHNRLAGAVVFLLTTVVQILALQRLAPIDEPTEIGGSVETRRPKTIVEQVKSSVKSIAGDQVLTVWVLTIAVIEGWLLFSTSYFQLDALSRAMGSVRFLLIVTVIPAVYGILALAASNGGLIFNWWRARAVKPEEEDHLTLRRGTKLEISRRRLIAAGGILVVMIIGFGTHSAFSAILLKYKGFPSVSYLLSVLGLLFFAFYQLLRGFAHPLLKTAMGRIIAKKQIPAPTTLLSLALGSGRLFHAASAVLFVLCLTWFPRTDLSASSSSTQALAAVVVIVGLTVVVLNLFCGLLLDRKHRREADSVSFWRLSEVKQMFGRRSFRVTVVKGAFFVCLAMSNILAPKFFQVGWLEFNAGAFAYALTFMFVDAIAETQGRAPSRQMWLAGIFTYGIVTLLVLVAVLPGGFNNDLQGTFDGLFHDVVKKDMHVGFAAAFDATFKKGVLGFVIASLCSFTFAQYLDIWFFLILKDLASGRALWIRNNITTFFAQTIDTVIFIGISSVWLAMNNTAFLWPGWRKVSWEFFSRILGQLSVKWMFSLIATPLLLLIVNWIDCRKPSQATSSSDQDGQPEALRPESELDANPGTMSDVIT